MRKTFKFVELRKLSDEFERTIQPLEYDFETFAEWMTEKTGLQIDVEHPYNGFSVDPYFDFGFTTDAEVVQFRLQWL